MEDNNKVLNALDEAPLSLFHLRAVLISGLGFFTDAYDLFIIGAALVLIKQQWHLDQTMVGLVGSTTLIANFFGAFIFGRLADVLGRKTLYGLVAIIMSVGAVLTAFSPNIFWLIAFRFILGLGIGGDYPISAVLMSEYANIKDRGKLVGMVFSMQALGLVAGPIVAITLLASGINHDLAWRIMLGLGALPALSVIYARRKMPESPRYKTQVLGQTQNAIEDLQTYTKNQVEFTGTESGAVQGNRMRFIEFITNRKMMITLLGTAGTWFAFDYAYYGNSISTPLIMKMVSPHASLIQTEAWTLIIFLIAAVPGYALAVSKIDKIGHKRLQLIGFLVMGLAFLAMGIIPGITSTLVPFLVLYGMSYFFAEFGPNTTTFILPSELFPVSVRTTGHGFSAGIAKIGAFIGVFVFPLLTKTLGLNGTFIITFAFSMLGMLLTLILPEPANKSIESKHEQRPSTQMAVVQRTRRNA
ncbi:MFS transporter [Alicyclobacillus fastidiosus]|uniref:MFS transporter n=1 Tax=Alicyclobacillus fastidiosus TaxID=392011 RepID=A0ABY6ZM65_9BACL|nr:MFS transporter [Alicyclobacillus fastidiosus]WAH43055.1 MFS transporter [Alicyclobacillus fastidiosus]GMA65041.1 MFS transporter [Alicyclobacillus fastidiosus]